MSSIDRMSHLIWLGKLEQVQAIGIPLLNDTTQGFAFSLFVCCISSHSKKKNNKTLNKLSKSHI